MKKKLLLLVLLHASTVFGAAVTYEFSGGRFGDCLLAYLHAKWISFVYDIPLLYKPFKYSEKLVLHAQEQKFGPRKFRETVILNKQNIGTIDRNRDCLYVVPYFSEVQFEHNLPWNCNWLKFEVNWRNREFFDHICQLIRPIDTRMFTYNLPSNKITVAVHVRKGGGFDNALLTENAANAGNDLRQYSDYYAPLKFPPEYFYTQQLKEISRLFNNQPIYAFVFTDDANPELLVERFKKDLAEFPTIELDYRRAGNHHDANVLEDFFALTKFDCIIRPESNFSLVAAKLAQYKVEIFPTEHHWEGTRSVIDTVATVVNPLFNNNKQLVY